jgi:hypothetical protein
MAYNFVQTEEYLCALSCWHYTYLELTHEQCPAGQRMPFTWFLLLSNLLKISACWVPRVNFNMVLEIWTVNWKDRLYFLVCGNCSECLYHCWLSSVCVFMTDHSSLILCEVLWNSVPTHSMHVKCQHSYVHCTSPVTHPWFLLHHKTLVCCPLKNC